MKQKAAFITLCVLIFLNLCSCADIHDESENAINTTAVVSEYPETDTDPATDESPYTGNGSAWCSALFESPSTIYDNNLAIVAAEMSEAAEDTTGEGIKELYSHYGIYAYETFKYTGGLEVGGMELSMDGGAFSVGQDTLNIDGVDTTILIITARGTVTWGEAVGDLFKGWYFDLDKVHSFLGRTVWDNVYDFEEQIWDGVNAYIDKYPILRSKEDLKILVTGHSLGGAAANMIGARFTAGIGSDEWWGRIVSQDEIYVYTFGAIKVLTAENNVSEGYENIHNIYNYYDSYGPYGNQKNTNASSFYAKFGHTEIYSLPYDETGTNVWDSCNSHLMSAYKDALNIEACGKGFIELACEENPKRYSEEAVAQESATETTDFCIEGTWKNIGTNCFGQAQLGAIVAFDGEHCNFYSPYDTYALYQEEGRWKLECTSVLISETLIFTLEIIDSDTINIYYGSDAVQLERIAKETKAIEVPGESENEFAIEGSWLSVGSDGFGQAQPGIAVTFDGTHCNFYSPYDTYAFYQDNGQWKLECTSFLVCETLTFSVEILDFDTIHIYYGSVCTELQRIN